MSEHPLTGLRLLVLEDELLIAMYIEDLCREHGAADVVICTNLEEAAANTQHIDAAIVDLRLGDESTLQFASGLHAAGTPFIFASGYTQREDVAVEFPDVRIIGKPYAGDDLLSALLDAIRDRSQALSG